MFLSKGPLVTFISLSLSLFTIQLIIGLSPVFASAGTDMINPTCNEIVAASITPYTYSGTIYQTVTYKQSASNPYFQVKATDNVKLDLNSFQVTVPGVSSLPGPNTLPSFDFKYIIKNYSWSPPPIPPIPISDSPGYPLNVSVKDTSGNTCTYHTYFRITEADLPFLKTSGGDVHSNR